jgi:hypothetical protein
VKGSIDDAEIIHHQHVGIVRADPITGKWAHDENLADNATHNKHIKALVVLMTELPSLFDDEHFVKV